MAKKLGKILFPEQYAPVGNEVVVSNSVEALAFFEDFYPKGGMVLLGNIRMASMEYPNLLVWMYFDIKSEEPTLYSTFPVFAVDIQKLNKLQILEITPHQNEVFTLWNDELYSSVFTDTGELVIKRVRLLANELEARQVMELQSCNPVTDMLPVELYSHSEHKFIGVCWATTHENDEDCLYWHPLCLDEVGKLAAYPPEDITDHPIEVGETAVIGGDTYRLYYEEKIGYYFRKISVENMQKALGKRMQAMLKERRSAAKTPKDSAKPGKTIILPINLKK